MDKAYLKDLLAALRAELIRLRFWCVLLFLVVAYIFLAVGLVWPKSFTTKVVLFADVTNIIEPLLKGRAEITKIDRSEQASEVIYTRRILLETAKQAGLLKNSSSVDEQDALVKRLREGIVIARERNENYVQISYTQVIQIAPLKSSMRSLTYLSKILPSVSAMKVWVPITLLMRRCKLTSANWKLLKKS
jgi:hypothetical protein